ncbi:hypothetical protein DPMN_120530 [Dreissena polymorpha]|uniref:Uncharacterized protein n=1 Tax=Dreissena polymorpha TaxID=45954 RepID=A0A9D4GNQ7_DREPO|nr:hypothetical protein DPMN_120530 [Dreissena polymorpha]
MFYYRHIRKTAPTLANMTNILTKFHEDWTIYVTLRVKTAPLPGGHENCPPPGGHFHEDWTINWTINVTSRVLTSFHEDQTKNVASRVLTRKHVDDPRRTTNDGQKVIPKAHYEHVVLRLAKKHINIKYW